ncbi:hypothetical protein GIB67_025110 [Kingdonia uniflora]|uniref:Uncharacterized protein n=1 Tax=Kingdonia uniflora TaxID=39325 RepID=A0A7J7N7Y6_9MAGN|nr:hypothetical protein GIB67_025110 [Kingdonia uniflora]
MEFPYTAKVLEQSKVSPPSGSVPQTSLPLTPFDVAWLIFAPVQRLFFYKFPFSTTHFMDSILPNLKHSLSITLQHFYPLAGNIIWHPQSSKPEIMYVDGDSVIFTVAESDSDFDHLCGYHMRNTSEFHPLVPQLEPISKTVLPALALQVTIFPNSGICIGININHVVADGKSSNHFMKSWASVCGLGRGNASLVLKSLPVYDRTSINDPKGVVMSFLKEMETLKISRECLILPHPFKIPIDKVLATFVMGQPEIERLKKWITKRIIKKNKQVTELSFNLSAFVVTCAYVWVCLSKAITPNVLNEGREHFICPIENRERVVPALPTTYFGNCLGACQALENRKDLTDEDGVIVAAEAIGMAIQREKTKGLLQGSKSSDKTLADFIAMASERIISIAGSPFLRVYDTDFGWGRPKKVEVISISITGAMSLSERSGGEVGIEVGLALKNEEMDAFASSFSETIKNLPE